MQRGTVATHGHLDQARAEPMRDLLRAIGATVVGDDHLAAARELGERALRLLDTDAERLRLVEAGEDDGHLDGRGDSKVILPQIGEAAAVRLGSRHGRRVRKVEVSRGVATASDASRVPEGGRAGSIYFRATLLPLSLA